MTKWNLGLSLLPKVQFYDLIMANSTTYLGQLKGDKMSSSLLLVIAFGMIGLGFPFVREGVAIGYVLAAGGAIILSSLLGKVIVREWKETYAAGQNMTEKLLFPF